MHPETRKVLKLQLKTMAKDLHDSKKSLRANMKANTYKVEEQYHISRVKREYRHCHLAYCTSRGRTLEEVENKTSLENPVNKELINQYLATFKQMDEENNVKFPQEIWATDGESAYKFDSFEALNQATDLFYKEQKVTIRRFRRPARLGTAGTAESVSSVKYIRYGL